jgi:hypothetical protein
MKFISSALVVALSSWSTLAAGQTTPCPVTTSARNIIFVARYSGIDGDEPKRQLNNFLTFLGDRIEIWRGSLNSLYANAPFLEKLNVVSDREVTKPEIFTPNNAFDAWTATPNRLQVLYGTVTNPNGRYTITSRVHLGTLEGGAFPSSVVLTLPIEEARIGVTNDAHSFVTYYSLALEARRLKCPSFVVRGLLAHAREVGSDLKRRLPNDPEVNRIVTSVQDLSIELTQNP